MKKLIILLLLLGSDARAEVVANYGVGLFHSAKYSRAETKVFSLGVITSFKNKTFADKWETGLWADQIKEGRKSSSFGSYSLGIRAFPAIFELSSFWGIGAISNKDAFLGGPYPQFFQDFYFGIRDDRGTSLGLNYKHISSAGIVMPNKGRDFMTIRVQWRW